MRLLTILAMLLCVFLVPIASSAQIAGDNGQPSDPSLPLTPGEASPVAVDATPGGVSSSALGVATPTDLSQADTANLPADSATPDPLAPPVQQVIFLVVTATPGPDSTLVVPSPIATTTPQLSYDGSWIGTTTQGKAISFTVAGNQIMALQLKLAVNGTLTGDFTGTGEGTFCASELDWTFSAMSNAPVRNGAFSSVQSNQTLYLLNFGSVGEFVLSNGAAPPASAQATLASQLSQLLYPFTWTGSITTDGRFGSNQSASGNIVGSFTGVYGAAHCNGTFSTSYLAHLPLRTPVALPAGPPTPSTNLNTNCGQPNANC